MDYLVRLWRRSARERSAAARPDPPGTLPSLRPCGPVLLGKRPDPVDSQRSTTGSARSPPSSSPHPDRIELFGGPERSSTITHRDRGDPALDRRCAEKRRLHRDRADGGLTVVDVTREVRRTIVARGNDGQDQPGSGQGDRLQLGCATSRHHHHRLHRHEERGEPEKVYNASWTPCAPTAARRRSADLGAGAGRDDRKRVRRVWDDRCPTTALLFRRRVIKSKKTICYDVFRALERRPDPLREAGVALRAPALAEELFGEERRFLEILEQRYG